MRGGLAPALELGTPVLESFALPPGRFVPKEVLSAWETADPHHRKSFSSTTAQKLGMAYQRKIERFVRSGNLGSFTLRSGVWFCYHDTDRRRFCSPDLLLVDEANRTTVIVEVKLRWTADAWWQVEKLYTPVLRRIHGPEWTFVPLVITKSYDPAVRAPVACNIISDLFDAKPSAFNVMVQR